MPAGTKNDAIQTRSSTAASTVNAVGNANFFFGGSAFGGVGGGGGSVTSSGAEGARTVEDPIESGIRRSSPSPATGGIIPRGRLRGAARDRPDWMRSESRLGGADPRGHDGRTIGRDNDGRAAPRRSQSAAARTHLGAHRRRL